MVVVRVPSLVVRLSKIRCGNASDTCALERWEGGGEGRMGREGQGEGEAMKREGRGRKDGGRKDGSGAENAEPGVRRI